MKNYDLFLPSYCIGNNVYRKVKDTCKEYGIKAVVIGGYRGIEAAKKKLIYACNEAGIQILDFVWYGGSCTYENVEVLSKNKCC